MSADKSFTSPIPFDLADAHTCPPPPHAHKSSIIFAYADTFITISASTDSDDDDDNSVDHTNDTKDDTPQTSISRDTSTNCTVPSASTLSC